MNGRPDAVNPQQGTKVAAHYNVNVGTGETVTIRLRLSNLGPAPCSTPSKASTRCSQTRQDEADEFYEAITPTGISKDEALVMRQALAGMLWSKQYFGFDVDTWLSEHGVNPIGPSTGGAQIRNNEWAHMVNQDIISMPDKWEYPWYAAWDLAFHTIALSTVDVDFAKEQLDLMLQQSYLHPTGQIPAYEWNFSDVNPPVHAWATIFLYRTEQMLHGKGDLEFLKTVIFETDSEFQLVGQPQRSFWKEPVRGWLSWPRQHRCFRPQRATAHRRPSRASGWHRVGIFVLPKHARDEH